MSQEEGEAAVLAIFQGADANGDGILDSAEFVELMQTLDASLTTQAVQNMMKAADVDNDGQVNVEEFVHWVFTAGAGDCKGAAHVKSIVHQALHPDGAEGDLTQDQLDMYWNQAQKACAQKPDGYASVEQMCKFIDRIVGDDCDIIGEFQNMWYDEAFDFAKGPAAKAAKEARGLDPEDHELIARDGFVGIMREIG